MVHYRILIILLGQIKRLRLKELGLPIDLAVGDLDSVSRSELEMIQSATKDCMIAPAEKG